MTTENSKRICPTCERRLSERNPSKAQYGENRAHRFAHTCPDPCHDVADAALQLLEALKPCIKTLEELNNGSFRGWRGDQIRRVVREARAAIPATKDEQVKP